MLTAHYIFTKQGAAIALGLTKRKQTLYYINKAKKLGLKNISKLIGGIEYFDVNMLKNPKSYLEDKSKRLVVKTVKVQLIFDFDLGGNK